MKLRPPFRLFALWVGVACLSVPSVAWLAKDAKSALPAYLQKALSHKDRPARDKKRDTFRKPGQVLRFFGVKPGMKVAEMMAGRGYYVEILSRALGAKGRVYAQNNRYVRRFADAPLKKRIGKKRLPNVTYLRAELETPGLPKGLDAVLMILFYHDTYWMKADRKKMNAAIFKALKPGGLFCVIDHHAKKGAGAKVVRSLHRIEAKLVKQELHAAGFKLVRTSKLLHNPKDSLTTNVFRKGVRGRTSRFIYVFQKPISAKSKR